MFVKHPELKLKTLIQVPASPCGEAGLLEYRGFIYSENVTAAIPKRLDSTFVFRSSFRIYNLLATLATPLHHRFCSHSTIQHRSLLSIGSSQDHHRQVCDYLQVCGTRRREISTETCYCTKTITTRHTHTHEHTYWHNRRMRQRASARTDKP